MTTKWEYRVVRHTDNCCECLQIHEIYYNDMNEIEYWAPDASEPFGCDADELLSDLEQMRIALARPVLEAGDLPRGRPENVP